MCKNYFKEATYTFNKLYEKTSNLIKTLYKTDQISQNEETSDDSISTVIEEIDLLNTFLMKITNKPVFLVVKLERERQLLKRLKKEVFAKLGSAFIEENDLLPAFKNEKLQKYSNFSFAKEFSLAEKIVFLLSNSEINRTEFPPSKLWYVSCRSK